jgi:hypothetical protein
MSVDADHLGWSGSRLADLGHLAERAAHVIGPASSALGRIAAVVSVVKLGARVIPQGSRFLRRHPAASLLVAAGFLGALYLARQPRRPLRPPRLRPG